MRLLLKAVASSVALIRLSNSHRMLITLRGTLSKPVFVVSVQKLIM